VVRAGQLRQHFIVGDAYRCGERGLLGDGSLDLKRHLDSGSALLSDQGRDIKIRFVEGERFYKRRVLPVDGLDVM